MCDLNKMVKSRIRGIRGGGLFSSKKDIFNRFAEEYPAAFLASRKRGGENIRDIIKQLVDINALKNTSFYDRNKLRAIEKSLKQKLMAVNIEKNTKQFKTFGDLFTEDANEKSRSRALYRSRSF